MTNTTAAKHNAPALSSGRGCLKNHCRTAAESDRSNAGSHAKSRKGDNMDGCEKIWKITGQEKVFRPTLLQTYHATVSSTSYNTAVYRDSRYIEPCRKIFLNHPMTLEPNDAAYYLQKQGYRFYGGDYLYRRCPDGLLVEQLDNTEPDYAAETNLELLTEWKERYPAVDVLVVDLNNLLYIIEPHNYRDVLVGSQDGTLLGKFHLIGGPELWYLTLDGRVCILTSNGASEKRKNILRLYRLDQPKRI